MAENINKQLNENTSPPRRPLGQSGYQVTPVGLGTMQFSGSSGVFGMVFPDLSQADMTAIVRTALEGGINWFDTAELYGRGNSEQGLSSALHELGVQDEQVVICTKWFPILRTAGNIPRSIETRLHYLDGYGIDLYMIHQPWGFSSPEAEMDAMADLVERGKIRSIGVSNFDADRMARAQKALEARGLSLAVNQVEYSLLNRKIETNGVLSAARDSGVSIVAWAPLARGVLSGKFHNQPEAYQQLPIGRRYMMGRKIEESAPLVAELSRIAQIHGITPAQVALNWLINYHGEMVLAIPGSTRIEQVQDNAGAMTFQLTEDEMASLDQLSRKYR